MSTCRFDEHIDRRNTNSMNVEGFRTYIFKDKDIQFPFPDDEFIRMWVADMDFAVADEILDAVRDRLDSRILGYTAMYDDSYYRTFSNWCSNRYEWNFDEKSLFVSQGVVDAITKIVGFVTDDGDGVLFSTPSYGPFKGAAVLNNRKCIYSPLVREDGVFRIDFDDFEKKASLARVLIFCNPHNPTGRVWDRDELERICEIIRKYDLWVISDEIHCDILRNGVNHTPLAKVLGEYDKIATCMAPSKTFNLAGLKFSNVIIQDEGLARKWKFHNSRDVNPLSLAAAKAAYESGEGWLSELKDYLDGNFSLLKKIIDDKLPLAEFEIPDATYLAWVDLGRYFRPGEDIARYMAYNARVLTEGAANFVDNADGFLRLNIACPRDILEDGISRIAEAVNNYGDRNVYQKAFT